MVNDPNPLLCAEEKQKKTGISPFSRGRPFEGAENTLIPSKRRWYYLNIITLSTSRTKRIRLIRTRNVVRRFIISNGVGWGRFKEVEAALCIIEFGSLLKINVLEKKNKIKFIHLR